jgi:hypothetical protein
MPGQGFLMVNPPIVIVNKNRSSQKPLILRWRRLETPSGESYSTRAGWYKFRVVFPKAEVLGKPRYLDFDIRG